MAYYMPNMIISEKQSDGTMKQVSFIANEAAYVVERTVNRFHLHKNTEDTPLIFLQEVANYLDVSVDTIIKGFRAKNLPYCDYQVAKVLVPDLWVYLYTCYHPVGEILCKGEIHFIADFPVVHATSIMDNYIASMSDFVSEDGEFAPKKMLTAAEVSQLLGVGTKAVYKLLKSGKMPYFQIGSMYRIPVECLAIYRAINSSDEN